MVTVDIDNITIECSNCGYTDELDLFDFPTEINCCDDPVLRITEDVELFFS